MLWIIVILLALLIVIEIRNGQYLATVLAEIRDFLDEQPYRRERHERLKAQLRERWSAEARESALDSQNE